MSVATQPTPEQMEELNSRVKAFNAELIPLLEKYRLGIGAQPVILGDGRLAARPTFFDDQPKAEEPKTDEGAIAAA